MRLETDRLVIRPFIDADLDDLHELMQNPKLGAMAGWQPHHSRGESEAVLAMFLRSDEVFAIIAKKDQKLIGTIGLHRRAPSGTTPKDDSRELSFMLNESFWGQGIMPEATTAIVTFGFNHLRLQEIWVGHFADNQRSQRVIEKTGFHFEYELERPRLFSDETPVDEIYYKMTLADFRKQ
ncbi:GNAT family N-acetyltransferase [Loigolactobacillus zhaoyuanensis]|uniref:GNAT family N-acetyltransferase n=1 Tax=Loigolactobacillus zhaoyuanensis TaxID=2486017 RepID=A0ABW8UD39_9LACO|nr:GNAT family N-acetyltransferase [Loigolactobacillus zhaoyuanensis]